MGKRNVLIGCGVALLLLLCCGCAVGGYFGTDVLSAEACYEDAYDKYVDDWNAECLLLPDPQPDPDSYDTECLLPQDVADRLDAQLTSDEDACYPSWMP